MIARRTGAAPVASPFRRGAPSGARLIPSPSRAHSASTHRRPTAGAAADAVRGRVSRAVSRALGEAAGAPAGPALPFRIGHGWDLHRLEEGHSLVIGGIPIPHDRGTVAHSDGDVLLHTVTDALLGALALPDIGQLYPDTDPRWAGASSDLFLLDAVSRVASAGYRIGNVDATIVAQRPKLSPHKEAMRANLARLLDLPTSSVNIKAKTHEKVDSLGENRSIAAEAVVLLIKDDE